MATNETSKTDMVTVEMPATFTVNYSVIGDVTFDTEKLPAVSLARIFDYGLRQFGNDGAAVDKHERDDDGNFVLVDGEKVERNKEDVDADKRAGTEARILAIESGVFKTGGGGRALSPVETELRNLVNTVLRQKGISGVDATKMAKHPTEALFTLATAKVEKDGKGSADKIAAKALEILTAKAKELAAEHTGLEIDI